MRDRGGDGLRRTALPAFSITCTLVVALLGLRARTGDPFGWEARLQGTAVRANTRLDAFSDLGDDMIGYALVYGADAVTVAATLAAVALLVRWGRRPQAAAAFAVVAATAGLVLALKGVFDRPDGMWAKYELPSGHATRSLLAPGLLALVLRTTRWRSVAAGGTAAFAAAVGASLLYEDWHLASDVVAGWALALAVLGAAAWAAARHP